ncbi:MAG: EF-P beta-lysylation protein EpmB [Gammaproteobacteria bacterium]|nr:EF-P beta-lysylation protein EpmB [Gammaproteobacteria bacterium]
MIARSLANAVPLNWMDELSQAYSHPLDLLRDLALDPAEVDFAPAATELFKFRVTRAYARRMRGGDPRDPLLLQVLPRTRELHAVEGFTADPVGDYSATREPGLLQKYAGRALLVVTGGCAIHCRYCFRREFPYQGAVGSTTLAAALDSIAGDQTLTEVILSGGDPLTLRDARLFELLRSLAALPHLRRIRIHTRVPLVLPSRVTEPLLTALKASRLPIVMVLHINHPQEIDEEVAAACAALSAANVSLLNQSVLLRGINDNLEFLVGLSERLFDLRILPYYMHLLDRVHGSSEFEVDERTARDLQAGMLARLPGYLVPRFVREIPGETSKTPFL